MSKSAALNTIAINASIVEPFVLSIRTVAYDERAQHILNTEGESGLLNKLVDNDGFKYRAFLALFALRGIISAPIVISEGGKEVGAKDLIKALLESIHSDSKDATREYANKVARLSRLAVANGHNPFKAESVQALSLLAGKAKVKANEPSIEERERLEAERLEALEKVLEALEAQQAQELERTRLQQVANDAVANLEAQELESKRLQVRLEFLESILTKAQKVKYQEAFA